jgi:hypothetical protein
MKRPGKAAPQGQPALKIAIVGTASTSVNEAPWEDESWKIWSLGRNIAYPRFDRWFELHTRDVLLAANALEGRMDFLKKAGDKLTIGHDCWPEFPEAKLYPWEIIIKEFGRYLTSSLSEMIALAIYEGATEIGLWGVDMVCPDEYAHQRASCEYLLGIAVGRGIKVTVAKESPIIRPTRVYGYEDAGFSREIIERKAEAVAQLRELQPQLARLKEDETFMRGVIATLSDLETRYG